MVWFCKVNSYSLLSLYILLDSLDCSSAMPTSTTSILTFSLFCSSPTESVHFACQLSLLLFFHSSVHQVAGRNSCFLCILLTKYHSFRDCAMDRRYNFLSSICMCQHQFHTRQIPPSTCYLLHLKKWQSIFSIHVHISSCSQNRRNS